MAVDIPVGTRGIVQHAALGELTADLKRVRRQYAGWPEPADVFDGEIRATIQADGMPVHIALVPLRIPDLPSWVDQCANRIKQTIAGLEAIKAHIADDHLPLKNQTWLQAGELPVSKTEFMARLRLDGVSVYDDAVTVLFADGEMFGGHFLIVTIEDDGTLGEVQLAG